jgi:hypothetical protein
MITFEQYRICPRCQTQRPQHELFCEGVVGGSLCGWDLSGVDITNGTDARPVRPSVLPVGLACQNGHPVDQGDLLCPECGTDVVNGQPTQVGSPLETGVPGWQILHELKTAGTSRRRFTVRRLSDGLEAVLTVYSPGAQPDSAVYEALGKRLSKEHIAELIEHGRLDGGKAYDVTELVRGGSLAELRIAASESGTILRIVEEMSTALAAFLEVGLRHRALHPEKVLVRSREPLDLVVTGFESSRLSEADLEIESLLDVSRYTAPEAVMGAVTSASDWWGLGMMLLGIITGDRCFEGANEQLFLIHVQANGAPIPQGLDLRLDLLLRGLLTTDRTARWQWKEVRDWLAGGSPLAPQRPESRVGQNEGPSILLGGVPLRDPRRFAIEASRAANWSEACDLLAHGQIGLWAEELKLDGRVIAILRQLGKRLEPAVGFRLGIALQVLNPQLPLIYAEEIVNPDWLLRNPVLGFELISSSVPELLSQFGIESDDWLRRLSRRATSVRERGRELEIDLDESRWEVLVLSASRPRLAAQWEQRRKDFPDANHPGLASLVERASQNDEDLILLLSASLSQFRSREELVADTIALGERHQLPTPPGEFVGQWLDRSRRDLFLAVDKRIAGFARCNHERIDVWADHFRLEHRLSLAEAILVLAFPEDRWEKPKHQEYVASVIGFFEKRISAASRRGPLMRMTIGKTTPRVDFLDLAIDPKAAAAFLTKLIQRSGQAFSLDPLAFADENGPERRIRSLLNKTTQYQRDTGINGTYIGFPFLLQRAESEQTRPRLLPVMLWPVKLTGEIGRRGHFSLAFDSDRADVRVNPAFEGLYGVEGTARWRALAHDLISRSSSTLSDVVDTFGTLAVPAGRSLTRLPSVNASNQPAADRIFCCAVLFHLQFSGQSLVEDMRQLKQRPVEGTALETMLRIEADPNALTATEPRAAGLDRAELSDLDQPVLITRSDPSQEEAITKVSRGAGLVVQGPPGTGKSQTIVNVVAHSIACRKSVLIVCQKLPALEVVRKRLVAEKLENRIVMVTNVTADRLPVISEIRSQLEGLQGEDARQGQRRLREISEVETRIRKSEGEIDAHHEANHDIDPICERSYRQILGELIALDEQEEPKSPDVLGLRRLFRDRTWRDVYDCEEICGSVAEDWLAANHHGNPLESTLAHSHDSATAQEFDRVLSEFSAIEEDRLRIPKPIDAAVSQNCPVELEGWLAQSRAVLGNLSDTQLDNCAELVPLFRQNRSGDDYSYILQRLLELERARAQPSIISNGMLEWIGAFDGSQANTIAESCEQFANSWWSAEAEESPLSLIRSVLSPDACESFRSRFEHLVAVEKIRWQTVNSRDNGVDVQYPELLEKWLADFRKTVINVVVTAGDLVARLLPLPNPADLCGRYKAILEDVLVLWQIPTAIHASLGQLTELLVRCDDLQVRRVSKECANAAELWVKDSLDSQVLDGIAVFPRDQAGCVELQSAIVQFVEAELTRDIRAANRPKSTVPIEPNAFRRWAADYRNLIDQADDALLQDAANWQSLFRAEQGRTTKAEEFRKRFDELRKQIQRLAEEPIVSFVEEAVTKLDSLHFAEMSAWIRQVSENGVRWLNWRPYFARRRLRSWFRSQGIAWNTDLPQQTYHALRREAERRRIQCELEPILRGLSVRIDFSDWASVDQQVRRTAERLVAAYRICKAIKALPVAIDKRLPLNGWDRGSLSEWLESQQAWLEANDSLRASQVALEALRPTMSEAWLEWQVRLITAGPLPATHRAYLQKLAAGIPKLAHLTSFRSRLVGCDPLTPRVLAALSPVREAMAPLPPEILAREVQHQVRKHWVLARQQALELEVPAFRDLHPEREAEIAPLCEKLARVTWLYPVAASCPESSWLRMALVSGSAPAIQELFKRFDAGLEQAEARRASLTALSGLRDQMQSSWCDAFEEAIREGGSNEIRLTPLNQALPRILDYMAFQAIGTQLPPEAHQAFAFLAAERGTLKTVPEAERASEIARAIRWAFWKRKQTLTEGTAPVLRRLGASSVDTYASALNRLDSARRLVRIIDACPLPRLLVPAIQSRSAREVGHVLHEFELRILRGQALKRSLSVLDGLRDWMKSEWVQEMRRAIESGNSNADQLSRLSAAVPTFSSYQLFRLRSAALTPLHFEVFAALERVRPALREVANDPDGALSRMVRRLIRREALLAWKGQLERRHPAVLVNQNSLGNKLKTLQELDQRLRSLNRERLGEDLPVENIASIDAWEDITRLRGPRSRRLREFFHLGRERGLLTLRPVWMMTPDVASQLLPLENAIFDLVIFDEASQMPVEYAIPSLFRAGTVLVSGDEKQMPPSTFFSGRLEIDEAEWTEDEPLDDCTSQQERNLQEQVWNRREVKDCPDLLHLGLAALPKTTLQIHYRSEYRELISYSNAAFYRNELGVPVRHPDETVRKAKPIEYIAVNGVYGDQQNADEARKVVETVAEIWSLSEKNVPSVGVVTFNLRQADLIEELLEDRAETDEAFRAAYRRELDRKDDGEDMSFFVKNVENVQGDERDYIIFSTTFGRNTAGAFRRNFGVLGQVGGERRLNVAVTRARRKVIIVGSMPIGEISDMLRTRRRPEVPRDFLQAYLHYASLVSAGHLEESRGLVERISAGGRSARVDGKPLDGFKDSVARFIRGLGYDPIPTDSDPVLGVDFSIRDAQSGMFGIGIECDPPEHRLMRRARSREIWRQSILSRVYPALQQISAYAWYHEPDVERKRLRQSIRHAISSPRGSE